MLHSHEKGAGAEPSRASRARSGLAGAWRRPKPSQATTADRYLPHPTHRPIAWPDGAQLTCVARRAGWLVWARSLTRSSRRVAAAAASPAAAPPSPAAAPRGPCARTARAARAGWWTGGVRCPSAAGRPPPRLRGAAVAGGRPVRANGGCAWRGAVRWRVMTCCVREVRRDVGVMCAMRGPPGPHAVADLRKLPSLKASQPASHCRLTASIAPGDTSTTRPDPLAAAHSAPPMLTSMRERRGAHRRRMCASGSVHAGAGGTATDGDGVGVGGEDATGGSGG